MRRSLFVSCLLVATCYHGVHGGCSDLSYTSLEYSLRSHPSNMEMLVNAFFPTDHPSRTVVDVTYTLVVFGGEKLSSTVSTNHRVLRDVEYPNIENGTEIRFRWMASSIALLIEPDILEKLSLYAFQADIGSANLTLNVSSECSIVRGEAACHNETQHIVNRLLSELTSNVSNVHNHCGDPGVTKGLSTPKGGEGMQLG